MDPSLNRRIEQELDSRLFCRVHRSAIVNLTRVRELHLREGEAEVILASGTRLPLSRRYRKDVQTRMRDGIGHIPVGS